MPSSAGAENAAVAASQPHRFTPFRDEDDDDFQNPCTVSSQSQLAKSSHRVSSRKPLRPSNSSAIARPPRKRPRQSPAAPGKENASSGKSANRKAANLSALSKDRESNSVGSAYDLGLNSIDANNVETCLERDSSKEYNLNVIDSGENLSLDLIDSGINRASLTHINERKVLDRETDGVNLCSLIESRLIAGTLDAGSETCPVFSEKARILSDLSPGHDLNDHDSLEGCSLDLIKSSIECTDLIRDGDVEDNCGKISGRQVLAVEGNGNYLVNSIESRLMAGQRLACNDKEFDGVEESCEEFEGGAEFDVLLKLCSEVDQKDVDLVYCPLCGVDISDLSEESRQLHTNECLDKDDDQSEEVLVPDHENGTSDSVQMVNDGSVPLYPAQVVDVNPVLGWLHSLGLERYEEAFVREEIDWDSLQWLTEEDLCNIGINALGPRKKIMHAINQLRKRDTREADENIVEPGNKKIHGVGTGKNSGSEVVVADNTKTKLITDYFMGSLSDKTTRKSSVAQGKAKEKIGSSRKCAKQRNGAPKGKRSEIPAWCFIPGTPFRVDAFRYLRRDCSHWFLSHFHMDHYQGLTRSFCHGKIYCSEITAKLVNMKIGIPWDRLQVLPLNEKISIAGIDVTCFDANHCPGSIVILFEPPNGEAVLHTGDFRFSEEMVANPLLQASRIHTLILDTTYCQAQYDFPKQEAVVQFVLEAIQAEAFNPKTLFLIGSYTIGKERLFMEVARVLRKKVYVGAAKLRILQCFGYAKEDLQWLTVNEQESHIHVVPMWMLASFKRLKQIANQYLGRFSLIVAFSPTGWSFGKGKKKGTGRRFQQGTIIRYEVPYSEHCSFSELREFVKFISPVNIIPSVNNDGPDSADAMISLLLS
ncbi:hypothetical protein CDL15_Pgr009333 [Punica granatum]|uniref:SAM domain-containing protein n=1 Tax=Punica granatum TaxID=22663 RepID=A0A218XH79_PUNGR|nr:hypothetical protein CDL15_Pgr009333 [Punica granatum]